MQLLRGVTQRHRDNRMATSPPPELSHLSGTIVDAAFKVHKTLGPGLLESVYELCLCHELRSRCVPFRSQLSLPVLYDGISIEAGLRMDLIVDERIIVELNAVEVMHPIYTAQLLTYLKLTGLRVGLLINFNVPLIGTALGELCPDWSSASRRYSISIKTASSGIRSKGGLRRSASRNCSRGSDA